MKKAIWLIAGGPMQYLAAKKIKEMGYNLILSDGSSEAFCRPLADHFLEIDTFDIDGHLSKLTEIKKAFDIKAVVTVSADCHGTVARLGQALGIHHLNPEISVICRDKSATRELLRQTRVKQPESYLVSSFSEATKIIQSSKATFVIKATDNSGSRGFAVIPSTGLTKEQFDYTVSMGTTGKAVLEEKLEADPNQISEASVETIWFNGKMYWLNWVDRIFPRDLKFFPQIKIESVNEGIEVGHINPASHEFEVKKEVHQMMWNAGVALGMDKQKGGHVLKGDIFFSTGGPILLEMTPRCSGGWDSGGSSIERGANIAEGLIRLALGEELNLDFWFQYFAYQDSEKLAVVLSTIPDQARDCTGRKFAIASGYGHVETVMKKALNKLNEGDFLVPLR